MILFASQRGRSAELAAHLLNGDQNDHVTVHDIRGFVSEELVEALKEAYAISRGTRCKQFLFSVSLNPPEYADVPVEEFEAAIEAIEVKMGLVNQPRIIVFHEKNGRRHCHAVWSRIDADKMVAVNLAHFKRKLMEVSRLLFLKNGWKLPKGMVKNNDKSPLNLTRQEYRQAVRLAEDPTHIKTLFKSAWEQSDSKAGFISFLEEHGFLLAKGDRRGFVAIDIRGGVYSLTRWIDIGTRDLKARLGAPESLPDIDKARAYLASRMTENIGKFMAEAKTHAAAKRLPLVQELRTLVHQQRLERQDLLKNQQNRWQQETRTRSQRLAKGIAGIWQRVTGEYQKIKILNEVEAKAGHARDRKELHAIIREHLQERQELQKTVQFYREEQKQEVVRLRQEIAHYVKTATEPTIVAAKLVKTEGVAIATDEKVPLAAQLAQLETKIALLSGDISLLQSSLESNLISDDLRSAIRRMLEKTLETIHIKTAESKQQQAEQTQDKIRSYQQKQDEFNDYIKRYAEIQLKIEEQRRKAEANRGFYSVITNMSYALNGLPKWQITVMSPPVHLRVDEQAFTINIRQIDNRALLSAVFTPARLRPALDPKMAVPALRQNVLEVKELLRRSGIPPASGKMPGVAPTLPLNATIKIENIKL